MARNRLHYIFFIFITIALGLLSRTSITPQFIYPYLGDTFYALLIYFGFGFLFPKKSLKSIFILAVGFCVAIEISQLYQADWINVLRSYKLGGLILGFGFLWSDLVCYVIGSVMGFALERKLFSKSKKQL